MDFSADFCNLGWTSGPTVDIDWFCGMFFFYVISWPLIVIQQWRFLSFLGFYLYPINTMAALDTYLVIILINFDFNQSLKAWMLHIPLQINLSRNWHTLWHSLHLESLVTNIYWVKVTALKSKYSFLDINFNFIVRFVELKPYWVYRLQGLCSQVHIKKVCLLQSLVLLFFETYWGWS